jgi:drug/metabolite transporter (DMT)-like permease
MTSSPQPDSEGRARAARDRWIGASLLALSGAGFATLAILVKFAYGQGMRLAEILVLRFGGAALLLFIYLSVRRRSRLFPGWRTVLPLLLLGTFGYAVQATLYVGALQRIPASVCGLLLYSYPALVALLDWLVNRRRPARREWAALALALVGVILTIGPADPVVRLDRWGIAMVLISAVWYAGFILASNRFAPRLGSVVSTAWITIGATLSFFVLGWATASLPDGISLPRAGILAAMIVFSTILPIGTFLAGMARVGPTAASLLSTLEPVFTASLAAVLLGEALMPIQVAGGALILAAVLLLSLPQRP